MICTITPNPSLDITYFIKDFHTAEAHRTEKVLKTPGGKGLNVSKVLHLLGHQTVATGFIGGATGQTLRAMLDDIGIAHDFEPIAGETRSCLTIQSGGEITEIREPGPIVTREEYARFLTRLSDLSADHYHISGSLPQGLGPFFYDDVMTRIGNGRMILDSSGELFRYAVQNSPYPPYAVKPNETELSELFPGLQGTDAVAMLDSPLFQRIPVVLISLGRQGAVAKIGRRKYRAVVPEIHAVNPVGSGDAAVAGLSAALVNASDDRDLLSTAMACGVLNACEEQIGYIDITKLSAMKKQIQIKEIL